jgi:hypothetical protein
VEAFPLSKFNSPTARPTARQPVTTTGPATTYEGGAGFARDTRSDLVLLAVTNMVGEQTFYESGSDRDTRYAGLVRACAVSDPQWTLDFLRWLRGEANMRSASLVGAAEFVKGRLEAVAAGDLVPDIRAENTQVGGWNRKAVDAVLQRADEPGEFLAYWTSHYGRRLPQPVKRGVADAVRRLYTERSLLKYDTASHGYRFADVIDLVHPGPASEKPYQGDLFVHALDRRHGHADSIPERLLKIRANASLRSSDNLSAWLNPQTLDAAGMTWEDALSAVGSKVDKAALWSAMIPSMGIMALIRNLRNFDESGVTDAVATKVCARLMDPAEIARSRQFPFRFLSAYRAAPSLRWGYALDTALTLATSNIPALPGRTLVMVDTSASMQGAVSAKSTIRHVDVGALFGVALAARGSQVDLVGFADGVFPHPLRKGGSVLAQTEAFTRRVGEVGHGTNTVGALRAAYSGHDRVVILHDGQYGSFALNWPQLSTVLAPGVPLFSIDTTGYQAAPVDASQPNRYEIGGFSDKLFTMVSLLSRGRDAGWPWEG